MRPPKSRSAISATPSRISLPGLGREPSDRGERPVQLADAGRVPLRMPRRELVLEVLEPCVVEGGEPRLDVATVLWAPLLADARARRETVEQRRRRVDERIVVVVAEERPPERDPAAGPKRREEPSQAERFVDPVERRGRDGEIECADRELGRFERRRNDLDARPEGVAKVRGERGVRLDADERLGAEREQPPGGLTRPRADFDHSRSRAKPAALGEHLVHPRGMTWTRAVVRGGIGAEQPSSFLAGEVRHAYCHGGGLCTQRPPTIVATTSTDSSSSGGHSSGSRERTTRSAR